LIETEKGYFVDSVTKFSEIDAKDGILGRFPGGELMGTLKQLLKW